MVLFKEELGIFLIFWQTGHFQLTSPKTVYLAIRSFSCCWNLVYYKSAATHVPAIVHFKSKFTVTGPTHPVVAIVGEDAILECRLVPDLSASNMVVRWLKSDLGSAVHAYRNGEDDTAAQDHDYRGRTEQFKDELSKGNVSLRIKNTRVFDEGKYICSVDDETDFEETVIELKVGGLGREHWIQIEGYHQNGIQLVCESNGWFPQPQVLWTGGDGQNLTTQSKINYHRDSKGLVNVQSNVAVTRDSTNRFKCLIRNNLLKKEQEATIQIAGDFFPAISGWLVFLSVILSLVIVALAAGNIWTVKQHRYFKELEVDKSIKQFDQWKSLIDSDWKKISECQDCLMPNAAFMSRSVTFTSSLKFSSFVLLDQSCNEVWNRVVLAESKLCIDEQVIGELVPFDYTADNTFHHFTDD
ncbi:butyrophilin subfamily 3 member A2-like [Heterodontus francisci]|uniref:butyrophilin subfamily 3 member A2-like n=1 Tax=Heterodontus francisci TaxID=7792 RepID=UPI00355B2A1F